MKKRYLIIIIIKIMLFAKSAYAYLDPGFASMLFQSIVGFFALLISFVSIFYYKIKVFFIKVINKIKNYNKK